jgi:hypothetical protein
MQQSCLYKKWCRKYCSLTVEIAPWMQQHHKCYPVCSYQNEFNFKPMITWMMNLWTSQIINTKPSSDSHSWQFVGVEQFCQKSKPAVTPLCTSRSTSVRLCIESITQFGSDNIVDMLIAEHCNLQLRNHISMLASLTWIYTTVKQMAKLKISSLLLQLASCTW